MKIDYRLKNRIRFNQLDDEAKLRLRRFHHFTTAQAALQILQSGAIWADGTDVCPHFSSNRKPKDDATHSQEVCLNLSFSGTAHLVAEDASSRDYQPNALYVHLYEWPDHYGLQGMRVAQVRVSAGTVSGLQCVGFTPSPEFLAHCKSDLPSAMVLTRIKRLLATPKQIHVPADAKEREATRAQNPPYHPGWMELWKMKLVLLRRRWQKKRDHAQAS